MPRKNAKALLESEAEGAPVIEKIDADEAPDWFHLGQLRAWEKDEDVVLLLCGTQSGKTVFGPPWLLREMQRKGPGEYAVVSPNYTLLFRKAQPEFLKVFRSFGRFVQSPIPRFEFSEEGLLRVFGTSEESCTVYFGYAENSDSLESMTLKAVWSDECGQSAFKHTSYEALNRRLAVMRGRHLMTTTPYEFGWLKSEVYDRWVQGAKYIGVVSFESTMNPTFCRVRYERARREMPPWRFQMMYEGQFTRPAGAIYDCFSSQNKVHRMEAFEGILPPDSWRRFVGIDFGNVNTAAVLVAEERERLSDATWGEPTGRYIVYQTYYPAENKAAREHARELLTHFRRKPVCYGGSHQEEGWREAFSLAGLWVREPDTDDVETQINRVYAGFASGNLVICSDLEFLLHEVENYSRELDENAEPTERIRQKAKFHRLDALRYICSHLFKDRPQVTSGGWAYRFGNR